MKKATTKITLDTRKPLQNSLFSIVLRVTYQRKFTQYSTNKKVTPEDWVKIQNSKSLKGDLREIRLFLNEFEAKANKILHDMQDFTFEAFKVAMFGNKNKETNLDVYGCFEKYINELSKSDKINTAATYQSTLNSLKAFHKKATLTFQQSDQEFLNTYHSFMVANGKSITTVSIYSRCIKAIFNRAIEDKVCKPEFYPFGKKKYQPPTSNNPKKALTLEDIAKIFNYSPANRKEQFAKDIFLFSYLCGGINIKDISFLTYSNLDLEAGNIYFIRAKTAKDNNFHTIRAALTTESKEILIRYTKENQKPEDYIFPILSSIPELQKRSPHKNKSLAQMQAMIINERTRFINKYLSIVAQKLGIEKHVTTYTARHSFATILKRSGASIEFISESLGHRNIATTRSYLDSFDSDFQKQQLKALTNFKPTQSYNEKE